MRRGLFAFVLLLIISLDATGIVQVQGNGEKTRDTRSDALPSPQISPGKMISGQEASPLFFVDQMTGWVLSRGLLYGTTDGGSSWNLLNSRDARRLTKIFFLNEKDGWAIYDGWTTRKRSNYILSTQDGGHSWKRVREIPTPVYTIFFLNSHVGYFTPRWESIERTIDGGNSWEEINSPEGLNYVFFVNEKTGWGYGFSIWHTDDGGQSWVEDTPNENISDLYSAKILSGQTGWIVGSEGQVWRKTGEKGWLRITNLPIVGKKIYGIDFVDNHEGWITAEDGAVLHTIDGGGSWQIIAYKLPALTTVRFIGRQEGWALDSRDNLLHTTDGGKQWVVVNKVLQQRRAR